MAERATSLNDFFTSQQDTGYVYTDIDCLDISSHLNTYGYIEWAKTPRVYIILRLLNKVNVMDDFLRLGLNDMCLPFDKVTQLPKSLGSLRQSFIDRQTSVWTTAITIEKGLADGNHVRIPDTAVFPYESLGPLGQSRYGVDQVRSPLSGELFARKLFRRSLVDKNVQQEFLNELNVLKRIDHEHCVRLVRSILETQPRSDTYRLRAILIGNPSASLCLLSRSAT
jgi:serine/threonine protein kinase